MLSPSTISTERDCGRLEDADANGALSGGVIAGDIAGGELGGTACHAASARDAALRALRAATQ